MNGAADFLFWCAKSFCALLFGKVVGQIDCLPQLPAGVIFTVTVEMIQRKQSCFRVVLNLLRGTRGLTLPKAWFGVKHTYGSNSVLCSLAAWGASEAGLVKSASLWLVGFNIFCEMTKFLWENREVSANCEEGAVAKTARRVASRVIVAVALTTSAGAALRVGRRRFVANAHTFYDEGPKNAWGCVNVAA